MAQSTGELLSPSSSAPCAPTGLNVRMQKINQICWAMTSWDSVNCSDVEYLAEMTGRIQNNPQALMEVSSYWWPRKYFEFPMPCSTAYNITVTSRNSAGVSKPSSPLTGVTGNFKFTLVYVAHTSPLPPKKLNFKQKLCLFAFSFWIYVYIMSRYSCICFTAYEILIPCVLLSSPYIA